MLIYYQFKSGKFIIVVLIEAYDSIYTSKNIIEIVACIFIFFNTFNTVDIYFFLYGSLLCWFRDILLKHLVAKCTKNHPWQHDQINSHSETKWQSLLIHVNKADKIQVVIVSMWLMSLLEFVLYFGILTILYHMNYRFVKDKYM